jgi:hypothetical protein
MQIRQLTEKGQLARWFEELKRKTASEIHFYASVEKPW